MTEFYQLEDDDDHFIIEKTEMNGLYYKGTVVKVVRGNEYRVGDFSSSWLPEAFAGVSDSDLRKYKLGPYAKKPHKHAELIKAWADGEKIQYRFNDTWINIDEPKWDVTKKYRIKPEKVDPIVRHMFVEANPTLDNAYNEPNLKLTFDGDSGKIINVEIIR